MPNRNYVSGRFLEYSEKKFLESKGYLVIRSAGSHTPVDLFAAHEKNKLRLLIQCKKSKNKNPKPPLSETELKELLRWTFVFRAEGIISYKNKDGIHRFLLGIDLNLNPISEDWF